MCSSSPYTWYLVAGTITAAISGIVAIKALGQYVETAGAASKAANITAARRVLGTLLSVSWTLYCVAVLYLAFGRLGFDPRS